ncbi:hypothetical protein V1477_011343, partial [Vespula maculifrons]
IARKRSKVIELGRKESSKIPAAGDPERKEGPAEVVQSGSTIGVRRPNQSGNSGGWVQWCSGCRRASEVGVASSTGALAPSTPGPGAAVVGCLLGGGDGGIGWRWCAHPRQPDAVRPVHGAHFPCDAPSDDSSCASDASSTAAGHQPESGAAAAAAQPAESAESPESPGHRAGNNQSTNCTQHQLFAAATSDYTEQGKETAQPLASSLDNYQLSLTACFSLERTLKKKKKDFTASRKWGIFKLAGKRVRVLQRDPTSRIGSHSKGNRRRKKKKKKKKKKGWKRRRGEIAEFLKRREIAGARWEERTSREGAGRL